MKKIIALAVASAFVAPAFAADVTITGEFEYQYEVTDGGTDAVTNDESTFTIAASEEIGNGITVKGAVTYEDAASSDQGVLSLSSADFGTFSIGDAGGPIDSLNEFATGAPEEGGDVGTAEDMSITWKLPQIAPGLTVILGMSPESGANSTADDASGFALGYSFGDFDVYYGADEIAGQAESAMGVKWSANGITLAYETKTDEDFGSVSDQAGDGTKDTNDTDLTGIYAGYKMGNIEVGIETQEVDQAGTKLLDQTIYFVQYHLGPVDLYVEQSDDDVSGGKNKTNFGVEYAF